MSCRRMARCQQNYWVPVCRMPKGYRVPGLVKLEITLRREVSTAQSETDGLKVDVERIYDMRVARLDNDTNGDCREK